jgi:hypothetical protein
VARYKHHFPGDRLWHISNIMVITGIIGETVMLVLLKVFMVYAVEMASFAS